MGRTPQLYLFVLVCQDEMLFAHSNIMVDVVDLACMVYNQCGVSFHFLSQLWDNVIHFCTFLLFFSTSWMSLY